MESLIEQFVHWMVGLSALQIYGLFLVIAYTENLVPPIPGDVFVAFGGYLAAEGILDPILLLAVTTAASVAGFMSAYGFGSYWGDRLTDPTDRFWLKKIINMTVFERGRIWMQRWGMGVVFANRFLAGTRSVIALTAGMSHTPVTSTALSSALSSLLWNALLVGFGWVVKSNWQSVGGVLNTYGKVVLIAVVGFFVIRYVHSKLRQT